MFKKSLLLLLLVFSFSANADSYDGVQQYKQGKYKRAFTTLFPYALAGDTTANLYIGDMYFKGLYLKKNYQKAYDHYVTCTKSQSFSCQYSAQTLIYLSEKKLSITFDSLTKLATNGDAYAQYLLANVYFKGLLWLDGSENMPDYKKWLKASSDNGYYLAQYDYANRYLSDSEVNAVYKIIVKNLLSQKDSLNGEQLMTLMNIYTSDRFKEKDEKRGFDFAFKAAELNYEPAVWFIAYSYFEGYPSGLNVQNFIIPKDIQKSYEYYKKSAALGNYGSKLSVELLEASGETY